jgi:metallophosphoesterase (TIGR00282 family)
VKILFIGDIVGEPGRRAVKTLVPLLRIQHELDAVIANGENSAGGSGITPKTADEIFSAGVDAITSGDHLWDQKEVTLLLEREPRFLRPLNYPPKTIGQGSRVFELGGRPSFAVLNVQGRVFMPALDNPFTTAQAEVERLRARTPIIVVDVHAEATSEKIALGRLLDGKVSAVIGTHTHVQTADERILPKGTAYLTDVGMTGPHDSIIGMEVGPSLARFLNGMPSKFEPATGNARLNGVIVEADDRTGLAKRIVRISYSDMQLAEFANSASASKDAPVRR